MWKYISVLAHFRRYLTGAASVPVPLQGPQLPKQNKPH